MTPEQYKDGLKNSRIKAMRIILEIEYEDFPIQKYEKELRCGAVSVFPFTNFIKNIINKYNETPEPKCLNSMIWSILNKWQKYEKKNF